IKMLIAVLINVVFAGLASHFAIRKNRSAAAWFAIGLVLGVFAFIAAAFVVSPRPPRPAPVYPDGPKDEKDFLSVTRGFKSWALTFDPKRIGIMYLCGILGALLTGGLFALLVRTELWTPGRTIVSQDTYNQFFTLHGAVMVFLVIIPGIPAALGNIIMPIQL